MYDDECKPNIHVMVHTPHHYGHNKQDSNESHIMEHDGQVHVFLHVKSHGNRSDERKFHNHHDHDSHEMRRGHHHDKHSHESHEDHMSHGEHYPHHGNQSNHRHELHKASNRSHEDHHSHEDPHSREDHHSMEDHHSHEHHHSHESGETTGPKPGRRHRMTEANQHAKPGHRGNYTHASHGGDRCHHCKGHGDRMSNSTLERAIYGRHHNRTHGCQHCKGRGNRVSNASLERTDDTRHHIPMFTPEGGNTTIHMSYQI